MKRVPVPTQAVQSSLEAQGRAVETQRFTTLTSTPVQKAPKMHEDALSEVMLLFFPEGFPPPFPAASRSPYQGLWHLSAFALTHLVPRGAVGHHGVRCPFRRRQKRLKEREAVKQMGQIPAPSSYLAVAKNAVLWIGPTSASLRTPPLRPQTRKTGCSRSAPRRRTCSLQRRRCSERAETAATPQRIQGFAADGKSRVAELPTFHLRQGSHAMASLRDVPKGFTGTFRRC